MSAREDTNIRSFLQRAIELENILYAYDKLRKQLTDEAGNINCEAQLHEKPYILGEFIPDSVMFVKNARQNIMPATFHEEVKYKHKPYNRSDVSVSFTGTEAPRYYPGKRDRWGRPIKNDEPIANMPIKDRIKLILNDQKKVILKVFKIALIVAFVAMIFADTSIPSLSDLSQWICGEDSAIPSVRAMIVGMLKVMLPPMLVVLCISLWKYIINAGPDPYTTDSYIKAKEEYEAVLNAKNAMIKREIDVREYCYAEKRKLKVVAAQVREELDALYANAPIFPKYCNFDAVSHIEEYFASGRCEELTGPFGAYTLYESESRVDTIIYQLDRIANRIEKIHGTMQSIENLLHSLNSTLSSIDYNISALRDDVRANTAAVESFNAYVYSRLH